MGQELRTQMINVAKEKLADDPMLQTIEKPDLLSGLFAEALLTTLNEIGHKIVSLPVSAYIEEEIAAYKQLGPKGPSFQNSLSCIDLSSDSSITFN